MSRRVHTPGVFHCCHTTPDGAVCWHRYSAGLDKSDHARTWRIILQLCALAAPPFRIQQEQEPIGVEIRNVVDMDNMDIHTDKYCVLWLSFDALLLDNY